MRYWLALAPALISVGFIWDGFAHGWRKGVLMLAMFTLIWGYFGWMWLRPKDRSGQR